jgi:hypothetical protein
MIDKKGIVYYVHNGEGNYNETEHKIISLLADSFGNFYGRQCKVQGEEAKG